jgi:hypothetical protein
LPEQGRKNLPIRAETHRLLKKESAETGIFITDLVDLMWEAYCTLKEQSEGITQGRSVLRPTKQSHEQELLNSILQSDPELAQTAKRTLKALAELAAARAAAAKQTKAG